jgi:large subunit ribosomal protein L4
MVETKRSVARPRTGRRATAKKEPAVRQAEAPQRPVEPEGPSAGPRELRRWTETPEGHLAVIAADGSAAGSMPLPDGLRPGRPRRGVLFQAIVAARANARLGSARTRNRARVRGGGAKPWRQKGTGRARHGSIRGPQWRHGAVAFGPNGRSYAQRVPEKVRHAAFAQAFAARAAQGHVAILDSLPLDRERPRTREARQWIDRLGEVGRVLVITAQRDGAGRAVANAPRMDLRSVGELRLADILGHDTLLVTRDALGALAARAAVGQERAR